MEERALAELHSAGTALLVRIAEAPCRDTARTAIRENISMRGERRRECEEEKRKRKRGKKRKKGKKGLASEEEE